MVLKQNTNILDDQKARHSIVPNLIHELDGEILKNTVLDCKKKE